MRIDEMCNVSLIEVESESGRTVRYLYSLLDIEKIKDGSFNPRSDGYRTLLIEGE